MYNSHMHIFRDIDVPVKFLPLQLVRFITSKIGFNIVTKLLDKINPFSETGMFERYEKYLTIGHLGSQEKVLQECQRFYPKGTKFVALSMDMSQMEAGKVRRDFDDQLKELGDLKQKYPDIIYPFVHVDPRRDGSYDRVVDCIEKKKFAGVKIYPTLGYFPYDERLYPIYKYCEEKGIPIMTHCSPRGIVNFRGSKKQLKKLLDKSKTPINYKGKDDKDLCSEFTNPKNWEYVLRDFPKLKVCCAHFGGEDYIKKFLDNPDTSENWFGIIKGMLSKYENFYTDISYSMNNQDLFSLTKVLLLDDSINKKILFGSDFYMVESQVSERRFSIDLRAYLGEEMFNLISVKNVEKYLG